MTQERDHELMEQGALATQIAGAVRDAIDEMMVVKFQRMIALYRQGNIDHDMIIGLIGECAGLQDLLSNLQSKQVQAEGAMNREFTRGTKK